MVNKPHAPRGANKAGKKPAATTLNGEDSSFIVFGNDNDKPKRSKKPADGKAAAGTSDTAAEPEQKKPDTRTLIGGASWTGKLPQTMFNEHCQKQKWEKPEYTMRGNTKTGFTGGVIIKQKNPKTQEITTLPPIVPPSDYLKERGTQESAVEARHFAAAYALFRVSNMKNIHMMLPPTYRDLWKGDFQDLKSAAIAQGQGYLYEADPFLAKKQHDEAIVAREKARADRAKQQVEDKKLEVVSLDGQVQSKHVLKGWMRVPKVEMGVKTRREVERQIRRGGAWNLHAVHMTIDQRKTVVDDLSNIGFRRSHVEEAAELCKDREECLEWLLIHVPEDDLPKWCLPDNYLAGVSMASGDLKREGQIKRLAATGYSSELCADMLELHKGDESRAAEALQARLLHQASISTPDATSDHEIWDEELATSEAIFGDRFTNHERICTIVLQLQTPSKQPIVVRARPPSRGYPNTLPVLTIEAALPAYVRLAILKQVLVVASSDFLGAQMLFSIVDWLEQNIPAIIEKPGKLSEVASATATSTVEASKPASRRPRRQPKPISWTPESPLSQKIREEWSVRQSSAEQQKMLMARRSLPAWNLQDEIVQSVTTNQVTIISGETGSGKSTQSVQFILDDLIKRCFGDQANIICTQPRRISALGLADRVADERCVKVGDEVGYAIRGESKQKPGVTKITFVTTGVLLRRLQTSGGSTDDVVRSLADVSHVIIDEVHERSLDTDFLLVLLRDVLKKRKDLRLVLMSATLDAQTFESYFSSSSSVGKIEIEGRTHPVTDIYLDDIVRLTGFGAAPVDEDSMAERSLDDGTPGGSGYNTPRSDTPSLGNALRAVGTRINYDLIARTVELIDRKLGHADGGILIFLPGVAEIDQTLRALRSVPNLHTLPLHASLQSVEQRRVFPRAPQGLRKVIAATNVAETSITIEDIVAVIDTGRVKETSFDPANNMVKLAEVWASRAACKQRRGRAGRVRAGECYKLYTRSAEAKMAERPDPEIRRVPLEQLCLSVRAMGVSDVPAFLASALTPPESLAVEGALKLLSRMGALDSTDLTALGRHLSMIPADLRCGKLMVYGAAFGCLDATITIAAILTVKSPFVSPKDKREESKAARSSFGRGQGDLLCDHFAYEEWSSRRAAGEPTSSLRRWCDENFLSHQTLLDISTNRVQYLASLQETGFLPSDYRPGSRASQVYNQHNGSEVLLRALIAGSFQPQVARIDFPDKKYAASSSGAVEVDPEARTIKYFNEENGRVFVHPSSTLFDAQSFPGNSVYMSYFTKMATSKVFIRDLTPFNVYALLMFGGKIEIDPQGRGLLVDNWVRLRGWARIGVLVSRMRMMLDELLEKKLDDPALELESEHSLAQDETILHVEADDPENKLSKAQLCTLLQNIAHGLRHQFGIGRNGPNKDTITVISYGQILVPALFFGIIAAGGVYSAASPSSTVAELARQVKIGKSNHIICGAEHKDVAMKAAKECGISLTNVLILNSGKGAWKLESLEGQISAISKSKLKWRQIYDPAVLKESLIVILWSSGTTGLPKGVMLSHTNLVAETYLTTLSGREWAIRETEAGRPPEPKEYRTLGHLPISHIAGLFGYLIAAFYSGGQVVWMGQYRWDDLLRNLKRYTITAFYTVPSIWLRISKSPEIGPEHLGSIEGASTGSAPMDSELQKASNSRIGDGKTTFIGQTWGLSETTGAVTAQPKGEVDDTGCIGSILPSVELRMVDEDFHDVEPGQEGELLVRSPLVTRGYFDNPKATAEAFHEGWFCTGDIAVFRNGKFYVVDRKKELLKYKGLQVAPAEIENLLFTHPKIREAAVVGVPAPDDPGTDWPRAYAVLVEGEKASEDEVKDFVKQRLAPYKQLRGGVVFVDEIPKNAIGKFLRRELRERAKREIKSHGAKFTFPRDNYYRSHVLRDASPSSNFTKRWQPCDWQAAAEAITIKPLSQLDKDCELPLNTGTNLDCMLTGTDADQWASKWTDEDKIKAYGWEDQAEIFHGYEPYDVLDMGLEKLFEELEISTDEEDWVNLSQQHSSDGHDPDTGELYPETYARYSNRFNLKQGVLLAAMNTSPKGINEQRADENPPLPPILPLPPLQNWSDLVFLAMQRYAKSIGKPDALKNLRHIVRHTVANEETIEVLKHVIGKEMVGHGDTFPAFEFSVDDPRIKAALGSPNGKGVAWLLGQHKRQLGNKFIDYDRSLYIYLAAVIDGALHSPNLQESCTIMPSGPKIMNPTRFDRRMSVAILSSIVLAIVLSGLRLFAEDIKSSKVAFAFAARGNESLHHHAATLLGRQVDSCDWANIVANSQDEPSSLGYCERLYVEGNNLMCMLNDASQSRNQATGQMEHRWATSWTDPDSLEDWGWDWSSLPPGNIDNKDLDQAFSDTHVNIDPTTMHNILISHSGETVHDGVTYPETEAHFDNYINQDFRALVAAANWSPEFMNSEREPEDRIPPHQITKLRNWSDVLGLGFDIYAEEERLPRDFLKNLQHVFRHGIVNFETLRIMRMVFEVEDLNQLPFWPGTSFEIDDPKFAVLLTSPNARGVAWLLGQHKATMGVKVITRITGFKCGPIRKLVCMYLKIGNGPVGSG
ncbi:hypothetical protein AC578_9675 [Pseudocercospora eumusae]|uniref:RNA helicase n=1 Tax=Pseudocercospora eumusae TaxID=321146 RepID=A0A139HQP7_9PEZI|nr:hypothetical protein AC578_9675 [Pseudocercospora eumusae]